MSAHHLDPGEPRLADAEPASLAEAVRVLLAALIGAGWLTIDSATVNWIVTVVGLLASVAATVWTRRRVTPVAAPKTAHGRPLAPAAPQTPPDAPSAP